MSTLRSLFLSRSAYCSLLSRNIVAGVAERDFLAPAFSSSWCDVTTEHRCRRFSSRTLSSIRSTFGFFLPVAPVHTNTTRPFTLLVKDVEDRFSGRFEAFYTQKRLKKKSAGSSKAAVDDDLDDDEDNVDQVVETEDDGTPKDYKVIKAGVIYPRADAVMKVGFNMSRTSAEEAFYEGKWRLNGEKVTKKSIEVAVGDELDLIEGPNAKNNDFLDVNRIIVEDIGTSAMKSKITVQLKVWKNLAVDNYPAPHKYTITGN